MSNGNPGTGKGAGLYVSDSLTLTGSSIYENTIIGQDGEGGAIYFKGITYNINKASKGSCIYYAIINDEN